MKLWQRFVREEEGLETVEYAVITALIVAALIGTLQLLGGSINSRFEELNTTISSL